MTEIREDKYLDPVDGLIHLPTTTVRILLWQKPTPQTPPALVKKTGKTTYRVWAHFSTTSTETNGGQNQASAS